MTQPHDAQDKDLKSLAHETKDLAQHAKQYYSSLSDRDSALARVYRDNPYAVLAGAAGIGYLLAGGLFSPFTRRVMKMGVRAMIVPMAAIQLKNFINLSEGEDQVG